MESDVKFEPAQEVEPRGLVAPQSIMTDVHIETRRNEDCLLCTRVHTRLMHRQSVYVSHGHQRMIRFHFYRDLRTVCLYHYSFNGHLTRAGQIKGIRI